MNRIMKVAPILIALAAFPGSSKASNELKQLRSVCLGVDLSPDVKKLGLGDDLVQSTVFVDLKRDLTKLEVHESCTNDEDGLFNISITTLETFNKAGVSIGHATVISFSLRRPSLILSGKDLKEIGITVAEVWRSDTLLTGQEGFALQVTDVLHEFETKFASEWYKDN